MELAKITLIKSKKSMRDNKPRSGESSKSRNGEL
jgi:hypothetical protein